jgi:hypothetical protein
MAQRGPFAGNGPSGWKKHSKTRVPTGNALAPAVPVLVPVRTPSILLTLAAPFIWLDTDLAVFKHGKSLVA